MNFNRSVQILTVTSLLLASLGGCAGGTIGSGLKFSGEPRHPADANALLLTVNATFVDEGGLPLAGLSVHVESPKAIDTTPLTNSQGEMQSVLFAEKGKPLVLIVDPTGANTRVRTAPIVTGQSELNLLLRRVPGGRFAARPRG